MQRVRFQFDLRALFIATAFASYLAAAWRAGAFGTVVFFAAAAAALSLGLYRLARPKHPFLKGLPESSQGEPTTVLPSEPAIYRPQLTLRLLIFAAAGVAITVAMYVQFTDRYTLALTILSFALPLLLLLTMKAPRENCLAFACWAIAPACFPLFWLLRTITDAFGGAGNDFLELGYETGAAADFGQHLNETRREATLSFLFSLFAVICGLVAITLRRFVREGRGRKAPR